MKIPWQDGSSLSRAVSGPSPNESVSVLLCQTLLLFLNCMSRSQGGWNGDDTEVHQAKTDFAHAAWHEVRSLEKSLQSHSWASGGSYCWLSGQYLFL